MNKCSICGRFRPWTDLIEEESTEMDLYGNLDIKDWYECRVCVPEKFKVAV